MIYLDHAATTLQKPPVVGQAMLAALQTAGNPGRGAHEPTLHAARIVYDTRTALAELFHAEDPACIAFAANATQALNTAIGGLLSPGDHVIATVCEHNSVLRPLYRLREQGMQLSFVGVDDRAVLRYEQFEQLVRPNTRAIIVTGASNVTGHATDLPFVAQVAKKHGLLLIVDAAQTAGSLPIDVQALGIDVLCFTGHKGLMGPQGTGGLCVREGVDINPWKVGGTGVQTYLHEQPEQMPARLEAGTLNGHGIAGLNAALDFLQETGVEAIHAHEMALLRRFVAGVKKIPGVALYGDFDHERTAVAALNIGDMDSGEVSDILSEDYGIATRPGAHCAPRLHEALGTQEQGAVRFSFGWYNTEEEADAAVTALREIAT